MPSTRSLRWSWTSPCWRGASQDVAYAKTVARSTTWLTKAPKKEGVCDVCGGELYQRKDDTEESLKVRLDEYTKQTQPVLDYYDEKGLVQSHQR